MPKVAGSIEGLQALQQANAHNLAALRPDGALGRAVLYATTAVQRYAMAITHVDTGSWRASHRMDYRTAMGSPRGEVFVDPGAVNPRSGAKPVDYATKWEQRGGEMAVYQRTINEQGDKIGQDAVNLVKGGLA